MTTADPPAHPTDPIDEQRDGYNLAARIYGNGPRDENGQTPGPATDGNGQSPAATSERYNLAAQVYGDGASNAAATNGNVRSRAPERYNLASRIYGDSGAGSNLAVAPPAPSPATAAVKVASAIEAPPAPPRTAAAVAVGDGGEPPKKQGRFRTFESLSVPAFRWYLLAQLGAWGAMNMQMLVRSVIVFQLTGSYAALGTTALFSAIPGIGLTMFGGLAADRFPKKRIVQIGQTASALSALSIGTLLYFDQLQFWHLLATSVVQGSIMALMMPSRQAMMPEVVGMDRLMNATALGMGAMNLMRLAGPAAGGVLLATAGGEAVYLVIVLFYIWSIVMLAKVPLTKSAMGAAGAMARMGGRGRGGQPAAGGAPRRRRGGGSLSDIADGLRYIKGNTTILMLLVTSLAMVAFSMPYQMMLPGYVLDVLGKGPETVGLMMSIMSIGSLGATLVIASLPPRRRGALLLMGGILTGGALVAFPLSTAWIPIVATVIVIGVGQSFRQSLGSVLVQTYVEDEFRGRVMSVQMMQMNMAMLATFFFGILAATIGPQLTVGIMGGMMLVVVIGATIFLPRLRRLD
jgi:MFS family permease